MKTPRIANALNQVDEDIVSGAARAKKVKKNNWLKWGSIAACFVVMLAAMLTVMPMLFEEDSPVVPPDNGPVNEGAVNDSGIAEGKLEKYKQASGMKTAIKNIVDEYAKTTLNKVYGKVIVVHTDNQPMAQMLADALTEKYGVETEIRIMGPVIGAHVGPNSIAYAFMSNETRPI